MVLRRYALRPIAAPDPGAETARIVIPASSAGHPVTTRESPMTRIDTKTGASRRGLVAASLSFLLLAAVACSGDDGDTGPQGPQGPQGPAGPVGIQPGQPLPGLNIEITAVRGGTGPGGNFRVGDRLTLDFTMEKDDGSPLEVADLSRASVYVSGPTFNYQRVIAPVSDLIATAVRTGTGTYTYQMAAPIPATYLAPYNDTTALTDGELTGQDLLEGTYTVAIEARKEYTVDDVVYRDPGNAVFDFILGSTGSIASREVVSQENCNACHTELRAHGNNRYLVTTCLMCHTAGSEDKNVASAAGGTPGETIEFKVMIHKIHAGQNLPSVLGMTTNPDGSRNYAATPEPYQLVGFGNSVIDFSHVRFPVWPSLLTPMPRDIGYASLTSAQQAQENSMRGGPVDCAKCHGDPDDAGPLAAPAQGELAYIQQTRRACGSCHDDVVWSHPYTSNLQTMPAQNDDATCLECHGPDDGALSAELAHRHPLTDPTVAPGVKFHVSTVTDAGGNNNGKLDPGEKIRVQFTLTDDANNPVAGTALSGVQAVFNGPTTNPNVVHFVRIAPASLGAGPNYDINLPMWEIQESVGVSTATLGETFQTDRIPHVNTTGAETWLFRRTGTVGAATSATAPIDKYDNYIDVATPGPFTNGCIIVVDDSDPNLREYYTVRWVQGNRLWLSSQYSPTIGSGTATRPVQPWVRRNHAAGALVQVVTLANIPTTSYTVDRATGLITETVEFGTGEILCSYMTDFVIPAEYPGTFNESEDLGQESGDWRGLPLLDGTYTVGIYGTRSRSVTVGSGTNATATSYTDASKPANTNVLFGNATAIETVARISSFDNCYACHVDVAFHGGSRRGVETCNLCHGVAGAEDAANYIYPTANPSPDTTVAFRTMLHKIHHGKNLAQGANYVVVGNSGTPHTYEQIGFPSMPGGTQDCAACHGKTNTAWYQPNLATHPQQTVPLRSWWMVCGSCHDSEAVRAHIDVNTASWGGETCEICHGSGEAASVKSVHVVR